VAGQSRTETSWEQQIQEPRQAGNSRSKNGDKLGTADPRTETSWEQQIQEPRQAGNSRYNHCAAIKQTEMYG